MIPTILILESNLNAIKIQKDKKTSENVTASFKIFVISCSTNWPECPNYVYTVKEDNDNITTIIIKNYDRYILGCNTSKRPDYIIDLGLIQKPTSFLNINLFTDLFLERERGGRGGKER